MQWRVDDSTIEVKPGGMFKLEVVLDGRAEAIIPADVQARFVVPWKKRELELRRVGPRNGIESLLYIDDELCAPSKDGPARGKKDRCGPHGKATTRRCPGCDDVVCLRCLAVDGVRCEACFETAGQGAQKKRRRAWLLGAAFMLACAVGLFLLGASGDAQGLGKFAGVALFGAGVMAWAAYRQSDGSKLGQAPLVFALGGEGAPQVAGAKCGSCKKRVGTAKAGDWCEGCRKVFHHDCRDGHRCKPPTRGPDWRAIDDSAL